MLEESLSRYWWMKDVKQPKNKSNPIMTIKEIIEKKRQSNRKYKEDAVEHEKVIQCIQAAHLAPSACNAQAWKFVVVDKTGYQRSK